MKRRQRKNSPDSRQGGGHGSVRQKEYLEKVEALLMQLVYRTIDKDPTNKLKVRLIQSLRRNKRDTNMGEGTYRIM